MKNSSQQWEATYKRRRVKKEVKKVKLMYCLYKNEHRIFYPVEITIRRGLRYKGEK
jgi:hypothetical protein